MQGSLALLVLKILARRGPLHGYAITAQIDAMSDSVLRVEQGSLYPALHRMEEAGWPRCPGSGIALGIAGAASVTRYLDRMLFGLSPLDPATFAGVSMLLAAVAAAGSYVPAHRATKVDPMVALRHE
jgi:ABC-type lipoprotein release transport system permease subunit